MENKILQSIHWKTLLAVTTPLLTIFCLWYNTPKLQTSIPCVGLRDEFFSVTRACMREWTAGLKTASEGYNKWSKKGKSFVLPDPGFRPHIILPPEHAHWLTSQPEDVLSSEHIREERFGLRYLLPPVPGPDVHIPSVLHYERVQEAFADKMLRTVDATLGMDKKEWRSVGLFLALEKIIYRAASVVTVGPELSEDEFFQRAFSGTATWLGTGIIVVGELTPRPFKILAGYAFRVPIALYLRRCTKSVNRVFKQQVEKHRTEKGEKPEGKATDLLTILAHLSTGKKNPPEPKAVARKLVIALAASMPACITTTTHMLMDLLGSDPELQYLRTLREEIESVMGTPEDWARPSAVRQLQLLDSALRESLRINPLVIRGPAREVMPEDGIVLPDARGSWLAISVPNVHKDERFYHEAAEYRPFRFLITNKEDGKPQIPLFKIEDSFLGFGHGKTACRGRWFAAHMMKLIMAYIIVNYEIQPLEKRPLNPVVGDHIIPPFKTTILLKRRYAR